MALRGLPYENQMRLPLTYKRQRVGDDLRLDLMVDKRVIVAFKTVSEILPVHEAQILAYMRLTGCRVGLLINFNVAVLKQGIRRFVL